MKHPKAIIVTPRDVTDKEEVVFVDATRLQEVQAKTTAYSHEQSFLFTRSGATLEIRRDGTFTGKGLYLADTGEWMIVRDSLGSLVLINLVKEERNHVER